MQTIRMRFDRLQGLAAHLLCPASLPPLPLLAASRTELKAELIYKLSR